MIIIKKPKLTSFILSTLPTLNRRRQGIKILQLQRHQRLQMIRTKETPPYSVFEDPSLESTPITKKAVIPSFAIDELVSVPPSILKSPSPVIIVFLVLNLLALLFGFISWLLKKICEFLEHFLDNSEE
uniref:Uncharacterized protein n=1 Tax=Udotea sp. TZ0819 TaxID=2364085 RepID=A0A386B230_9CHLO|nr:hypothetical protein [Udotea sp. TZ0819]